MTQYIDKSALVTEIEKRRNKNTRNKLFLAAAFEDNYLLSFIDTLEVKSFTTDASIEEICEWLKHNYDKYYYLDEAYDKVISIKNLIGDLKNYMKAIYGNTYSNKDL